MVEGESREDYLEAVLRLSRRLSTVRQVDLAEFMDFSKASISKAVASLEKDGLLERRAHGSLVLTRTGRAIAERVYERHVFFANMLVSLGIDEDMAQKDACRMEHALSEQSFAAMKTMCFEKKICHPE